jgi:putative aldouronate transport system permease protein
VVIIDEVIKKAIRDRDPISCKKYRSSSQSQISRCWQLYILILPAVAAVFLFSYVPMYGIQIAFKDFRSSFGIWKSNWVGLKHFIHFVTFPGFLTILRNTINISLYSIATFPCAVVLALLINEIDNQLFKKTVQMVSYAPHFISVVVLCAIIRIFLNTEFGIINNIVSLFGFERQNFLAIPEYFSSIYVWSGVWQNVGWGTIIYLAALSNVPIELIEAAKIDGANRLRIIWHINLPWILPTIITLLILRTGSVLSVGFEKIFLLQNPLNLDTSRVISTYVYEIGLLGGQFSYSAAIGLFNNIINIIIIVIVNQISKRISKVSLW